MSGYKGILLSFFFFLTFIPSFVMADCESFELLNNGKQKYILTVCDDAIFGEIQEKRNGIWYITEKAESPL